MENLDNLDTAELENLYQEYWSIHAKMIEEGHSPLEIASIIIAQGLTMYKTALTAEEYDRMVDEVSSLRYNVKELKPEEGNYH